MRGHTGHAFNERCDELANTFARGETPELRRGDGSWISQHSGRTYPAYLSLVDGQLRVHPEWPDCAARVQKVKGARHKKVRNPGEMRATLEAWGLEPEDALGAE